LASTAIIAGNTVIKMTLYPCVHLSKLHNLSIAMEKASIPTEGSPQNIFLELINTFKIRKKL
jgi:hypothetical protein